MLKAVSSGWGSCGPSPHIAGYQVKVGAPAPASLTFSAYLSATAPTTALKLQLTFYTADANHVGTETSAPLALTTTPQQLSFTASVPANAHYVQPEFLLEDAAGSEIIYVDFVVLEASPSPPAPPIVTHNRVGAWTTIFFDDFDTFDTTRWERAPDNWRDPPGLGSYDPSLVAVANSILTLKSEQRGGAWHQALVHGKTKGVRINTGLIEWRARMPTYVKGVHSGLWLMPCDSTYGWWPYSGEIDVIEYVGTETTPTVDGRQTFYSTLIFSDDGNQKKVSYPCNMQVDWDGDWHVYQCLWQRAIDGRYMFRFAVDDVPYGIIDQSQWVAPPGSPIGAPFDKDFYLIMTMSCGGPWAGMPEAQASRTTLKIDWVKVSQRS
jgi:beta-glucanase (GH16 family)